MKYIIIVTFLFSCKPSEQYIPSTDIDQTINDTISFAKLPQDISLTTDTIRAEQFGVTADYNGIKGTDNRKALQLAIEYCAANSKILLLPKGRILLNSYGSSQSARAHANILELKSNTNIVGKNSEIILGRIFQDKAFVLLSGLNAADTNDFKKISNVTIKNITFNFNSSEIFMASNYQLMRGIELGHCINCEVRGSTFKNGDLTSAIVTGYGNRSVSSNVKIHNNTFLNLIKSKKNVDHTSVYLNSKNSSINNNTFVNNSDQGKIVACAGELHNSNTSFHNNIITGYLRMNFVAAAEIENHNISNIEIYNNTARITSAGIYLWTDDNTTISNLKIYNNKVYSSHIDGYSMFYNGTQGILADAHVGRNTLVEDLLIENNVSIILKTNFNGRAVNFMIDSSRKFKNFKEKNNVCDGCSDGKYYKTGFKWPF